MRMQFLSTQMAVFLAVKATATGSPDHIRPILRVDQEASGLPSEGTADVPRNRIAQSFVPSFDAIGFVELYTADRDRDDGLGATISVALREESPEGPILGRTRPLDVSDRFFGVSTLFFKTSVAVVPGRLLFLEPVLEVGPRWGFATSFGAPYDAGMLILNGTNRPQGDLWFREGVTAAVFNPPVVVDGSRYLLAILNSRLFWFAISNISIPFGVRAGEYRYRLIYQYMEQVPIRPIDFARPAERAEHDALVALVERILATKGANPSADTTAWEREIDQRVHRLYPPAPGPRQAGALTPDEIKLVEDCGK